MMIKLMIQYRKISWWYWLITTVLLAFGLAGLVIAFKVAIALCIVQIIHFSITKRDLNAFPVQVRAVYLVLLLCGQVKTLYFFYWIQLVGTSAMVLVGYCFLARLLSLAPWNHRKENFSYDLIVRTFFSQPVEGNILQGLPEKSISRDEFATGSGMQYEIKGKEI